MTKLKTNSVKEKTASVKPFEVLVLSAAAVLVGCTTQLTATKVSDSPNSIEGQVYNLPRVEFSVELERELKSCSMQYESDPIAAVEWLRDQADLIAARKKHEEGQKDFKNILNDPVLKLADVNLHLSNVMGDAWKVDYMPKSLVDLQKLKNYFSGDEKAPAKPNMKLNLEVVMRATVNPMILPDPKQVYAIQYSGMMEQFKKTDYSVETYPNGTLKSINMTLDDQTGTIVQSVLQGAAKVAAANIGIPASSMKPQKAALPAEPVMSFDAWSKEKQLASSLCSAETRLKLLQKDALVSANADNAQKMLDISKSVAKQEKVVADTTKAVDDANKKLTAMDAKDPDRGAQAKVVEATKVAAKEAKKQLDALKKSQQALADTTSKSTDRIAKLRKQLTLTAVTIFSPEPATWNENKINGGLAVRDVPVVSIELGGTNEALKAWLDKNEVAAYCGNNKCENNWPGNALNSLFVEVALNPPFTELSKVKPPTTNSVVYRQPVRGLIYVCKELPCLNSASGKLQVQQKDILLSSAVDVPQMGVIAALPLINTAFQNNTLTAGFAETGALSKLEYVTNAVAAATADTFNKSADTYSQYKEARRTQEKEKLDQIKAEVDAKTALLESQLEQEKAKDELANYLKDNANTTSGGASVAAP